MYVGDAPVVAKNRDGGGPRFQAREIGICAEGGAGEGKEQDKLFHGIPGRF
jgi:hypothetical protein